MKRITLFILLSAAFASIASASEIPYLKLDDAVEEALKHNPEITAARFTFLAATAKIPQELIPEDPMVTYNYDEMRAGVPGLVGKPMRSYSISQKVPFPTKLILRSELASKEAKILFQAYREKERDIVARTKRAYYSLWMVEENIDIMKENETILEQFYASASARFSVGGASQQDALKAQVELAKVRNSLVLLDERREIARARINILMNRDPRSDLRIEKELKGFDDKATIDELCELARNERPRLQAFRIAIEKGKDAYMLAWNEFLPDFSGTFQQMIRDGQTDKWTGMLGVSVPIWFWIKQYSGVKQMKSELDMFKAEYNVIENMVLFEVKEAFVKVAAQRKLSEIYRTSFIPQAEQALKASLTGYEAGQVDFLNLLDSQRTLLDIEIEYNGIVAEIGMAEAELERSVGTDLRGYAGPM